MNPKERLELIKFLSSLPNPQFEQLITILEPPPGLISSNSLSQAERVTQLLNWVEGSTGPKMVHFQQVLEECCYSWTNNNSQQPQFRNDLKQKSMAIGLLSLTTCLIVVTLSLLGFLQKFELFFYDLFTQSRGKELPDSEILIIEITKEDLEYQDSKSMGRKDSSSLSDNALEKLLDRVEEIKPQIIGLDIYHEAPFPQILADRLNSDDRVFLICKVKVPMDEDEGRKPAKNILPEAYGFSDILIDDDDVVRRHLWAMETTAQTEECNSEISFSLAIAENYFFLSGKNGHFLIDPGRDKFLVNPSLSKQLTPNSAMYRRLDSMGNQTLLNYRSNHSPKEVTRSVYSLRYILENGFPSELEQGKIVLVGTNISESESQYSQFSDLFKTPYGETIPGVYLQAQFISQLIHAARGERALIWWLPVYQQIIIIVVYSISGAFVFVCFQNRGLILGTFIISISSFIVSFACFFFFSGWISWIAPVLALILPNLLGLCLVSNRAFYFESFRR